MEILLTLQNIHRLFVQNSKKGVSTKPFCVIMGRAGNESAMLALSTNIFSG